MTVDQAIVPSPPPAAAARIGRPAPCRGGVIAPANLPDKLRAATPARAKAAVPPAAGWWEPDAAERERARVIAALEACGGNQADAAAMLGISRRTLLDRLDQLAIPRPRKGT